MMYDTVAWSVRIHIAVIDLRCEVNLRRLEGVVLNGRWHCMFHVNINIGDNIGVGSVNISVDIQ